MTKPLPRSDVQIQARRLGPPRLTAPERQALASVEDPALRKVLGEAFITARGNQANFDEIRQWFPIQPEDLADSVRLPENGEDGDVLEIGEGGAYQWAAPGGSEAPWLSYSVVTPETWSAKKEQRSAYYKWNPGAFGRLSTTFVVAVADGTAKPATALEEVKIGGEPLLNREINVTTGGPTVNVFFPSPTVQPAFTRSPAFYWIKFKRSLAASESTATKIYIVTIALRGSHGAASVAGLLEEVGSEYLLSFFRTGAPLLGVGVLSGEKAELPIASSGTSIIETKAGYAAEETGVAAVQLLMPTEALEEEWSNWEGPEVSKLSWTFGAAQPNARTGVLLFANPSGGFVPHFLA